MSFEGQQLGEFEILERLGQGGRGAVSKARQKSLRTVEGTGTRRPSSKTERQSRAAKTLRSEEKSETGTLYALLRRMRNTAPLPPLAELLRKSREIRRRLMIQSDHAAKLKESVEEARKRGPLKSLFSTE